MSAPERIKATDPSPAQAITQACPDTAGGAHQWRPFRPTGLECAACGAWTLGGGR